MALDAAEPLGVPGLPGGFLRRDPLLPHFPGTSPSASRRILRLIRDILESLAASGFRRILIVNGHGGNGPAQQGGREWLPIIPMAG